MKTILNKLSKHTFNFVYVTIFFLLSLSLFSCKNGFLSKSSGNNTTDITLQIPLELFNTVSSREADTNQQDSSSTDENILEVSLFVNDIKHETIKKNSLTSTSITFSNITIGTSVRAEAYIKHNGNEYSGVSNTAIVTKDGAELVLELKQLQQSETNQEFNFSAKATNSGVEIQIDNINIGSWFQVNVDIDNSGDTNVVFYGRAKQSSYTLLDKYVDANEKITYSISVDNKKHPQSAEVTTTSGAGRMILSGSSVDNGIKLTFNNLLPDSQIERLWTDDEDSSTYTILSLSDNSSSNNEIIDSFVTPNRDYIYYAGSSISNYDNNQGITYYTISNYCNIKALNGFGEFDITNEPVATVDYVNKTLNFSVAPVIDTSLCSNANLSISLQFEYNAPINDHSVTLESISYQVGSNSSSVDISDFFYPSRAGCTFVPEETEFSRYTTYIYDYTSNRSTRIQHITNKDTLSGLPQEIVIPPMIKTFYDNIVLSYDTLEDETMTTTRNSYSAKGYTENTDYSINGFNIILTDSGLDKFLAENNAVAIVTIYNSMLCTLSATEYESFYSCLEESDYTTTNNGKIIELTSYEAYRKYEEYIYNNNGGNNNNPLYDDSFTFEATTTNNGVQLSLTDIEGADSFAIFVKDIDAPENEPGERVFEFINSSSMKTSYTLNDIYVTPDVAKKYQCLLYKATAQPGRYDLYKRKEITITPTNGSGILAFAVEANNNGIKLSIGSNLQQLSNNFYVTRTKSSGGLADYAEFYMISEFTDYFVTSGNQYQYKVSCSLECPDDDTITYIPYFEPRNITATGGLGEIVITNTPAATIDYDTETINFTTAPELNISTNDFPLGSTVQICFNYWDPITSVGPQIQYVITDPNNIVDMSYWFDFDEIKGQTIVPLNDGYGIEIQGLEGLSPSSLYYTRSENVDNLSSMPQEINIPE